MLACERPEAADQKPCPYLLNDLRGQQAQCSFDHIAVSSTMALLASAEHFSWTSSEQT